MRLEADVAPIAPKESFDKPKEEGAQVTPFEWEEWTTELGPAWKTLRLATEC